jgi:hypothetical protein
VCSNQALAAVNAADRIAVITPGTARGRDALVRLRERLTDVGVSEDVVVTNRSDEGSVSADVTVPQSETTAPDSGPVCLTPTGEFPAAIAEVIDTTLGIRVEVDSAEDSGVGLFG